jgi:PadR family transcriptional regulator PadR
MMGDRKAPELLPATPDLLNGWARAVWGASDNNRRARYTLTAAGRKQLAAECEGFDQMILAIRKVLNAT